MIISISVISGWFHFVQGRVLILFLLHAAVVCITFIINSSILARQQRNKSLRFFAGLPEAVVYILSVFLSYTLVSHSGVPV